MARLLPALGSLLGLHASAEDVNFLLAGRRDQEAEFGAQVGILHARCPDLKSAGRGRVRRYRELAPPQYGR